MVKWEYCIVSGVETSLKRKLSLSLTFSNTDQASQTLQIGLDNDRNEEMFTTKILGELGNEGWELVAFHRVPPSFQAVLKRTIDAKSAHPNANPEIH